MRRCRICRTDLPEHQTFCSKYGARQFVFAAVTGKQSVFVRLMDLLRSFFRSEEEEEAEKYMEASYSSALFGDEATIREHEEAARLNPKYKSILAGTYAATGTERMRDVRLQPDIPWGASKDERHQASDRCTEPLLSAIREMMRDESLEAYQALDKAFHEALSMFNKSIKTWHEYPRAYARRAQAYRDMADNILMAYWIYPERILDSWNRFPAVGVGKMKRDKTIQHENVLLGFCKPKLFTGFQFANEVIWLYERAEEDFRETLRLDPTDAKCYMELSELLKQLGKREEAAEKMNKCLSILNSAIQTDITDERSYLERAEVYDRLGEMRLAIADLEHALTLATMEYQIKSIRDRIDTLRRGEKYNSRRAEYGDNSREGSSAGEALK